MEQTKEKKRANKGWQNKLKPEDRKTPVWGTVKKKYFTIAQKEVTELLKKYR